MHVLPKISADSRSRVEPATAPLSYPQERLWLLEQWQAGSVDTHNVVAIRLTGPLNRDALSWSLHQLAARHESWRTTVRDTGEGPRQHISPAAHVVVHEHRAERDEVDDVINTEATRAFDLQHGPLVRVVLVRLAAEDHLLLVVLHQIVSDAESGSILFRELTAVYGAWTATPSSPLPDLLVRYSEYAEWQRDTFRQAQFQSRLTFWTELLQGAPALLQLPADRLRPAVQSYRGARHELDISSLRGPLEAVSRQAGVSIYTAVLAAFHTLLARYTEQEDLVIGTHASGRVLKGTERLIGCFADTTVIRTNLSNEPSFRGVIKRVDAAMSMSEANAVPFARLVAMLQPGRTLSHSPVFQVYCAQEPPPLAAETAGALTFTPQTVQTAQAKYDLAFKVRDDRAQLTCAFEYSIDLFDAPKIERLGMHLQTLLAEALADPDRPISLLPLMSGTEREQLAATAPSAAAAKPYPGSIVALFRDVVEATPDAIAVDAGSRQLTYRELNERSNQLAHLLRTRGIGPDVIVGIYLTRSIEMLVALWGVLKAGGAYLPLDPQHPPDRTRYMLEDARVRLLLTQSSLMSRLRTVAAPIIQLDVQWAEIATHSSHNLTETAGPRELAYAIYTSGSTGLPKAVAVPRQSLLGLTVGMAAYYGLMPQDRVLQFASISFDVAVEEIFPTCTAGATIVLPPPQASLTIPEFVQFVQDARITVVNLPAAYWHQWVLELDRPAVVWPQALRLVITGSDRVLPERLARWQELVGRRARWVNAYGPTEATVTATCYEPNGEVLSDAGAVPIGSPVAGKRVYLLDQHLQPVPVGLAGDLYIGGHGLARGYLNRPELTAERFIPDPFSGISGARLYKTGDRAKYRPDGNLEFLGRVDDQVKVRGFRIELGEVEHVLRQHTDIRDAVVVAREDGGDTRLVGYVVPKGEAPVPGAELRRFLKGRLADHMVPSVFVHLTALPVSASGKVDRSALPAPTQSVHERQTGLVAPRTQVETTLVAIWRDLLQMEQVSVQDNFFELGGHSLLGVRMFARIEEAFNKRLPLATLLQAPTIEQLADLLDDQWEPSWSSLVPIRVEGSRTPFFCTHGVGAQVLCLRLLSGYLGEDQPFYGLQAQGLDGRTPPYRRIEDMAAHYIREIRGVQRHGPYLLGGFSTGGTVVFEMAQQLHAQGEQVGLVVLIDTYYPGPAKYIPTRSRFSAAVSPIVETTDRHLGRWTRMGTSQYAQWLRSEISGAVKRRIARGAKKLAPTMALHGWDVSEGLQRVIEANYAAEDSYLPRLYPGRLVLFWSSDPIEHRGTDTRLSWDDVAGGGLEVHVVPGNHNTMREEPHVRVLAAKLAECIQRALDV